MTNMQQLQLQLQQLPSEKWYTVLWFIFFAKLSSFYPNYFIKWFVCKQELQDVQNFSQIIAINKPVPNVLQIGRTSNSVIVLKGK